MHIDFENRRLKLSVSELANFEATPKHGFKGGQAWRAALGQKWHQIAQEHCIIEHPDARFEVALSQQLTQANWSIHLSGRIDQVIPIGNKLRLREVKTVRTPLPASPESLVERYPSYFKQLACYLALARKHKEWQCYELSAELYGIQIDTGTTQCIPIDPAATAIDDEPALANLIHQLELRRSAQQRWQSKPAAPPFEKLRPGQAAIIDSLQQSTARHLLLEAPTGFGKTGLVLQYALQQLQTGAISRCLYLTAKSSGQTGPIHQLQKMTEGRLPFVQMHSRQAHAIDCAQHRCTLDSDCDINLAENWKAHAIEATELCASGTLTLERAKAIGAATGICPYNLTCSTLSVTPFWFGDFNYIFAPSARSTFLNVADYAPANTLLIIDEAHNLSERVAQALSIRLQTADWLFVLEELSSQGFKRACIHNARAMIDCIDSLKPCQRLSATQHYELLDLCEDLTQQLRESYSYAQPLAPHLHPYLQQIEDLAHSLNQSSEDWLHWIPRPGILQANCIEVSPWIQHCLQDFAQCIHLSATLSPHTSYCSHTGIKENESQSIHATADWRTAAYQVAIDRRINTRFSQRRNTYLLTAQTILQWHASDAKTPLYAFFPSFDYAQAIKETLSCLDPYFRVALQERGTLAEDQADFLAHAAQQADAIFLIIGSIFAEGIDTLGAQKSNVLIVSPALAELSAVLKAKMAAYAPEEQALGFYEVCQIPAMRKIQQALGRFVRQPGQSARVLLQCQRFTETSYQALLKDSYPADQILQTEAQFKAWLLPEKESPLTDEPA